MICDSCPKAQQDLCDRLFVLKPKTECLMNEYQRRLPIIEELRQIREEIRNTADYINYTRQASVDAHNVDIDIINKHIKKLEDLTNDR